MALATRFLRLSSSTCLSTVTDTHRQHTITGEEHLHVPGAPVPEQKQRYATSASCQSSVHSNTGDDGRVQGRGYSQIGAAVEAEGIRIGIGIG